MSQPDKGNDSLWHDVGDAGAVQKVMGSLRQRKPKSEIGFSSALQQSMKQSQNTGNDNIAAATQVDLDPFSNWQQTFSNSVASSMDLSTSNQDTLLNGFGTLDEPLRHIERPISFPKLCYIGQDQSLVSEDENTRESEPSINDNPSLALSEEIPLAAALTRSIFDEDAQSGLPLLSPVAGSSGKVIWDFSDFHLLSPGGISAQDSSLNNFQQS